MDDSNFARSAHYLITMVTVCLLSSEEPPKSSSNNQSIQRMFDVYRSNCQSSTSSLLLFHCSFRSLSHSPNFSRRFSTSWSFTVNSTPNFNKSVSCMSNSNSSGCLFPSKSSKWKAWRIELNMGHGWFLRMSSKWWQWKGFRKYWLWCFKEMSKWMAMTQFNRVFICQCSHFSHRWKRGVNSCVDN